MSASRWSGNILASSSFSLQLPARVQYAIGKESKHSFRQVGSLQTEPRRPFDPLHPTPIEPIPSPLRPSSQYIPRNDESIRILREILDRLTAIESRLKAVEEALKTRR